MARVGAFYTMEPLQRLEDFSTFVSTIKSFGKPILPPLVTFEIRNEISQLRTAAVNRETVMLKRRKERLNHSMKEKNVSKNFKDQPDVKNDDISCMSEAACDAPNTLSEVGQDHFSVHNGTYVAVSKLSTKDIFSTVHKNVIVCPNVMKAKQIENDVSFDDDSDLNVASCLVCNHVELSLDCESCQVDSNDTPESNNFPVDTSSVPFADFCENNIAVSDDEQSSIIAETECGSLPTVIYNHNHDTDSESNVTSITQSTELEKYMVRNSSADYCSSEDTLNLGSKVFSQETIGSKSDFTSTETLINTANELTPCASVVAELDPYTEDTLSTVSEMKSCTSNDENSVSITRAHSVDSYMKLLKSCKQNFNVKKSQSDPCHKNLQDQSSCPTENYLQNCDETAEKQNGNASPVRNEYVFELNNDNNHSFSNSFSATEDAFSAIESNEENSSGRRHIRRNSYTLDQPSPVLVKALEDSFCNLDIEPNSHTSSKNSKPKGSPAKVAAFVKEKIDVTASLSPAKAKKLSVAGVKTLTENLNLSFVSKSDSQDVVEKNSSESEKCSKCYDESPDPKEISGGGRETELLNNNLGNMAAIESYFVETSSEDILAKAYQLIQENQKVKVQKLIEEQSKQWLKLQEDLKKEELDIYEKLKHFAESPVGAESKQCNPEHSNLDMRNASKILSREGETLFTNQNSALYLPLCDCESDVNLSTHFSEEFSSNMKPQTVETQNSHPEKEYGQQILSHAVSKNSQNDAVNSETFIREDLTRNFTPENTSSEIDIIDNTMQCHPVSNASHLVKPTEDYSNVNNLSSKEIETVGKSKYQTISEKPAQVLSDISNHDDSLSANSCCSNVASNAPVVNGHVESLNIKPDCNYPKFGTYSKDQVKAQQESQNISRLTLKLDGNENNLKNAPKNKLPSVATRPTLKKISAVLSKRKERVITDNPVLMKKFEKLPAFVKGYLTRRLFKTEPVKNLIRNLQDTALLIGKLSKDLTLKADSVSQNDVEFHRQLVFQLMTIFHNIYDIFCTISVKERMNIIAESRNLMLKKSPSEPNAAAVLPVVPNNLSNKEKKLSAATRKTLARKSKSSIDSRTYTVSDFQKCRMRPHSSATIKSHSVSPSRICKRSVAVSPKRKTASPRKSSSCRWTTNLK